MRDGFPVSVAELIAAGARPLPGEAVAILLDVCEQVVRRPFTGVVPPAITPSALFLDGSGTVSVAGGVPIEDDQTVQLLGRLLLHMLPAPGTAAAGRVPSRLRELATRAASGDLERISVRRLAASLRRFAPAQPKAALRALFERWRTGSGDAAPESLLQRVATAASVAGGCNAADEVPTDIEHPSRRGRGRGIVGALVAALLILAGVGAAYWLSADAKLPPVPLSPSLLSAPPPAPPRSWELLDPAGQAVESRPAGLADEQVSAAKRLPPPPAPQATNGSAHRPEQ